MSIKLKKSEINNDNQQGINQYWIFRYRIKGLSDFIPLIKVEIYSLIFIENLRQVEIKRNHQNVKISKIVCLVVVDGFFVIDFFFSKFSSNL